MGDIRVGDLVRITAPDIGLHGRVGIVRRTWKKGRFVAHFGNPRGRLIFPDEVTAVKRDGQWLTQVDGVWSA
jgi:hypothetical protein